MRDDLYDRLQRLPVAFHDRWPAGQLMSRAVSDLSTIRRFLAFGLVFLVVNIVTFIVGVIILICAVLAARSDHRGAGDPADRAVLRLRVALPGPGPPIPGPGRGSRHHRRGIGARDPDPQVVRPQRATSAGEFLTQATRSAGDGAAARPRSSPSCGRRSSRCRRSLSASRWCSASSRSPTGVITAGALVAFFGVALGLRWPIDSIGWLLALANETATASDRYFEVMDAPITVTSPAAPGRRSHDRRPGRVLRRPVPLRRRRGRRAGRPAPRHRPRHRAWRDGRPGRCDRLRQDDVDVVDQPALRRDRRRRSPSTGSTSATTTWPISAAGSPSRSRNRRCSPRPSGRTS